MEEVIYEGEQLLPGIIGQFAVIVAFVTALVAAIAYFTSMQKANTAQVSSWEKFGRYAFIIHGLAVLTIVGALLYALVFNLIEYKYVWQHSSEELPFRYVFSAFWGGQEGSFILWLFWHVILGFILVVKARDWEAPVVGTLAIIQFFISSMLLGIYVGDSPIGSSPFLLLRDAFDAPIFNNANYLELYKGQGLNPLLQNYWMTIHPPTLFLGFSLTAIPFGYVIGAIIKKDYTNWVKPTLIWTLVGVMILGIGILMGGAWAYEALSFGGFWAWDPVENASLVPWLCFVAALHTILIYKYSGRAILVTFILLISTFILVLYSTFLTRSGVLGDTSVHSFTDLGLSGQLLLFLIFFVVASVVLLVFGKRNMPIIHEEESATSREFWMFIGALLFWLSSFLIMIFTSMPVINKIFGTKWVIQDDMTFYNSHQIWFAILIGGLVSVTQFFKYKKSNPKKFFKIISISFTFSIILTIVGVLALDIYESPADLITKPFVLMFFTSLFAVIANTHYLLSISSPNLRIWGSSVTHLGFGLMLLGILVSQYKQEVISINKDRIDFGEAFSENDKMQNILLREGMPEQLGDYEATYLGDSAIGFDHYYRVEFVKYGAENEVEERFVLQPNIRDGKEEGQRFPNPDTKHFLTKDIYTHVTSTPKPKTDDFAVDTFARQTVVMGDTFYTARAFVVLTGVNRNPDRTGLGLEENDIAVGITLNAFTIEGKSYKAEPVYIIRDSRAISIPANIEALKIEFRVDEIHPATEEFVIAVREEKIQENFITLKALVFPYISVLWLGWVVTVLGFIISIVYRIKRYKQKPKSEKV